MYILQIKELMIWKQEFVSGGIRILKALNIKTNDILNIEQQDDKIIITVPKKKKISLKDRFATYQGENLAKDFSWDENIGKEIW